MFEPLQYEFFVRGLIAATTVGALCGLIGVYVVLRKMSYIGHGLSHAIFGGAVVSYVMSFNFYVGASLWGFASAVLINLTTRRRKMIAADAAIGIITTASFALGVALISRPGRDAGKTRESHPGSFPEPAAPPAGPGQVVHSRAGVPPGRHRGGECVALSQGAGRGRGGADRLGSGSLGGRAPVSAAGFPAGPGAVPDPPGAEPGAAQGRGTQGVGPDGDPPDLRHAQRRPDARAPGASRCEPPGADRTHPEEPGEEPRAEGLGARKIGWCWFQNGVRDGKRRQDRASHRAGGGRGVRAGQAPGHLQRAGGLRE